MASASAELSHNLRIQGIASPYAAVRTASGGGASFKFGAEFARHARSLLHARNDLAEQLKQDTANVAPSPFPADSKRGRIITDSSCNAASNARREDDSPRFWSMGEV